MICTALTTDTTTSRTNSRHDDEQHGRLPSTTISLPCSGACAPGALVLSATHQRRRPGDPHHRDPLARLDHLVPVERPRRPLLAADPDPAAVPVHPRDDRRRPRRPAPRRCIARVRRCRGPAGGAAPGARRTAAAPTRRRTPPRRPTGPADRATTTPAAASAPPPSISSTNSPDSTSAAISTRPTMSQITAAGHDRRSCQRSRRDRGP